MSGTQVETTPITPLTRVGAGDTILARLVPFDGAHQIVGVVLRMPEAALASARDLLAGYHDADGLATWWGEHFGPAADG